MSLIPFQGQRPSLTHPDTLRTVQSLGRLSRQLYDWYTSSRPNTSSTLMPRSSSRGGKGSRAKNTSMAPVSGADLNVRPPTRSIPQRVPSQISNKIAWDLVKVDTTITAAGSLVETNFSASLASHPQSSSWIALYDQWCIPQFSVTFRPRIAPGANTGDVPLLYTALDFDSIGALGSIQAIEDYATCAVMTMTTGSVVTRSVRPCVKVSTQQPGSNVNSSLERVWQDSGAGGTPWFGIRSILGPGADSFTMIATVCIWFAFRNQI